MKREKAVMFNHFKYLNETRERLAKQELAEESARTEEKSKFMHNYHIMQEMRKNKEKYRSELMEAARNDALATIVKAIYITALEADTLTDDALILAESMVDNWIKQSGGASKILRPVQEKTYLTTRIAQLVEEAAEEAVKEIEAEPADVEEPAKEEKKDSEVSSDVVEAKKKMAADAAREFIKDADKKDVKDFLSKVIDKVELVAAKKAEEKMAAEEPESEEEPKVGDDEEVDINITDDKSEEPAKEEEPIEGEKAAEEESTEEPKTEDEPKSGDDEEVDVKLDDEATPEEDGAKDDKEADVDVPAEDEPVKPTDSENGTPDEDPEDGVNTDDGSDEAETNDEKEMTNDEVDGDEDAHEDDDVSDAIGKPLDDDGVDSDTTVDGDTENKGALFDQLEKEEDVKKAVEIIKTRVADAEETFIRNNAEDKKKIDELISKISNNVKAVEDINAKGEDNITDKDKDKIAAAEESVRMDKKKVDAIRENRPLTVFEKMTRKLGSNIVKDDVVKEYYLEESGSLDAALLVESAKVMYGFLETINTLQLENVDENYIKNILTNM